MILFPATPVFDWWEKPAPTGGVYENESWLLSIVAVVFTVAYENFLIKITHI